MARHKSPTEKHDKGAAPIASSDSASETKPIERFKSLARRLVNVPRKEYSDAEREYRESMARKS